MKDPQQPPRPPKADGKMYRPGEAGAGFVAGLRLGVALGAFPGVALSLSLGVEELRR